MRFSVLYWCLTISSTRPGKLGWSGAGLYVEMLVYRSCDFVIVAIVQFTIV